MTWTITTTTTLSADRAVTLAERIPGEPIKLIVLHPGTGAGGTVTIWDDLGRSVHSTRIDALNPRHEAEFYSDRSIFNFSAAIDGNATLSGAGVSVYLVSREAPDASVAGGFTSLAGALAGPLMVAGDLAADNASFAGSVVADGASFAGPVRAPGLQLTASSSSSVPEISAIPDGTIAMSGPVRAPGLLLSESADFDAWLSSRGLRCVGWGSSTMADASRPQRVNVRTQAGDYSDCWNSFLVPAITRGIPYHLEWNGGVAGTSTTQILASIETDLADPTFPSPAGIDFAIIQPFANTIPNGVDPFTEEKAVTEKVFDLLRRFPHWKIVLIVPHTQNPMAGTHLNYRHAQIALRRIADRNPSRIEVADHYGVLSPFGTVTDSENLRDAAHLSVTGTAALYREWARIARWLGFIPKAPFVLPSGRAVATVSGVGTVPTDGYDVLNFVTHAAAPANELGTPRWDLTGTGALGMGGAMVNSRFLDPDRPCVEGKLYRTYIDDMEIIAAAEESSSFGPGVAIRGKSVTTVRWRSLQWFTQAATLQQIPVGWRIQNYLGPIIRATASMAELPTLAIYPGDNGGAVRVSFASLLEVPE